jgi:hypothetical protein
MREREREREREGERERESYATPFLKTLFYYQSTNIFTTEKGKHKTKDT